MMHEIRIILRVKLLPPPEPLRASMGEQEMEDLVASIKAVGILYPLLVKPYGDGPAATAAAKDVAELDRFLKAGNQCEIIDGHRRWMAAERAGVELLPCIVTDANEESKHAIMLHAGIFREDFTPAEEGWQFLELATRHEWSLDRLMRVFKVSESYINERVELVQKDDTIAQAVHTRQINLGQAHELLREKDPERRRTRTLLAIEHGYNARELRTMRQNLESERAEAQGAMPFHTPPASVAPDPHAVPKCIWCDQSHDPENLRQVHVHWYHLPELEAVCNQVGVKNVLRKDAPPPAASSTPA